MDKEKVDKTHTLTPELYSTLVFTLVEILTIINCENKEVTNCINTQTKGKMKKNKYR
jgi:hypothetical protein